MVGPLLRSLCSSTRRALSSSSSSSSSSYSSTSPFNGLNRAAAPASSAAAAPGRSFDPTKIRNVAVISHGDHGKTTLVDRLLRQCGAAGIPPHERALDSNISLEREPGGITISSKATSIPWGEHELNMVDTPGHTDFGSEVERSEFERWMSQHGRHYKDKNEWNFRFGIYQSTLRKIDYFNSQNLSFKIGINKFADLTEEELAKFGHGFNNPMINSMR